MKEYTVITSRESSLRLWKVISTQEEQMKQKDIALVMWSEEEFACTRVLAKIHFNYMRLELCFSFLSHCCFCLLLFFVALFFFLPAEMLLVSSLCNLKIGAMFGIVLEFAFRICCYIFAFFSKVIFMLFSVFCLRAVTCFLLHLLNE